MAATFQRCPVSSYLAVHSTVPLSITIRQVCDPNLACVFACRFDLTIAIASSSEYMGPEGVGVAAGVEEGANLGVLEGLLVDLACRCLAEPPADVHDLPLGLRESTTLRHSLYPPIL